MFRALFRALSTSGAQRAKAVDKGRAVDLSGKRLEMFFVCDWRSVAETQDEDIAKHVCCLPSGGVLVQLNRCASPRTLASYWSRFRSSLRTSRSRVRISSDARRPREGRQRVALQLGPVRVHVGVAVVLSSPDAKKARRSETQACNPRAQACRRGDFARKRH